MPGIEHRSVTPALKIFRDFLRGKKIVQPLRYADELAARTQPDPNVPGGPNHKSSKVYYYTRDARRLVDPPIEVYASNKLDAGAKASAELKVATPAKAYLPE